LAFQGGSSGALGEWSGRIRGGTKGAKVLIFWDGPGRGGDQPPPGSFGAIRLQGTSEGHSEKKRGSGYGSEAKALRRGRKFTGSGGPGWGGTGSRFLPGHPRAGQGVGSMGA